MGQQLINNWPAMDNIGQGIGHLNMRKTQQQSLKTVEKYLNIALDLDPANEEALLMQIDLRIKQSDINQSNELIEKLKIVCQKHCSKLENLKSRVSDLSLEKN